MRHSGGSEYVSVQIFVALLIIIEIQYVNSKCIHFLLCLKDCSQLNNHSLSIVKDTLTVNDAGFKVAQNTFNKNAPGFVLILLSTKTETSRSFVRLYHLVF